MSDARVTKRAAILSAATELFVAHGYAGASLRDIGRVADADASLVIHYFGSKESLFLTAMRSVEAEHPLLDGPLQGLGERYIRFVLESGPTVRAGFLAVLRAGQTTKLSARMRELHEKNFVEPLESRLAGVDVELRARLAAALVGGLLYSFWIVGDEYLLAANHEAVVRRYGRLLQDLVDNSR